MPKVNYLIAAAAHRAGRVADYGCGIEGRSILRHHLRELAKTDTSKLAQVTIIRALPLARYSQKESNYYWRVDDLIKTIKCPVVTLDVPDAWFSYSSWIHACAAYGREFDYYILCEDDYYPAQESFADLLVKLHQDKLPQGGYLCSFVTDHAAISNGIVDSKSFIAGISQYSNPVQEIANGVFGAQVYFGLKLFKHLADYVEQFRVLGWFSNQVMEYRHKAFHPGDRDIFLPVQYLGSGERPFQISVADFCYTGII